MYLSHCVPVLLHNHNPEPEPETLWAWYTMGLRHSGAQSQVAWYTMGLTHDRTGTQWDCDTIYKRTRTQYSSRLSTHRDWDTMPMGLVHKGSGTAAHLVYNGTGTQQTWYTMGLAYNRPGIQWDWHTTDLVHTGTGTQQTWYTLGLAHNRPGTQWDWHTTDLVHNGTGS